MGFRRIEAPEAPEALTVALDRLRRPLNEFSAAVAWSMRDAGKWSVIEASEAGELAGVLVLTWAGCLGGVVLEVVAASFRPGRYAAAIDELLDGLAASRADCLAIRMTSPRPVDRLAPGFERYESTYVKAVKHGPQRQ